MSDKPLSVKQVEQFREIVWEYFRAHARSMPWRDDPTPYHVLVSELMLQQTQVGRVLPKYRQFLQCFPDLRALAQAPLAEVLQAWSGLGYNRRAKFLHATAQKVVATYAGHLPATLQELTGLPGIGPNTAGAILAYAFNQRVVFIETNIRTVFFHHLFADQADIDDRTLRPLIEQACDQQHPREWYWALMDYGAYLKQTVGNNISRSRHYVRQSAFAGSKRQLRGRVIRELLHGPKGADELHAQLDDERTPLIIAELTTEGLIELFDGSLRLTGNAKLP